MSYTPLSRNQIAWRAAQDLEDGMIVNLGLGMPVLCANYRPEGREVLLQSENGVLGVGPVAEGDAIDPSPEAIDALLDVWPIFEAFQLTYVSKGLLLEQEKNASALSPSGSSAGASDTAKPASPARAASKPARTARRG